jgi:signal transduction histidine kinase
VRVNFASLPIRQGLLFVTAGLVGMLCVALALIASAQSQLRADLLHTVDTDIAGLVDVQAGGGLGELQQRIHDRTVLSPASGEMPLYLLSSRDGRRLAGNVRNAAALDPDRSEATDGVLNGIPAVIRSTRLADGLVLTVGRSLAPVSRLGAGLWRVFGWTAAALILISAAIGLIAARRLDARLSRLNKVFDRFDGGDLSARVGPMRHQDEIARLAQHVDAHLGTIARLLDVQRQISDNTAHELRTPLVHLDSRLLRALGHDPEPAVSRELVAAREDIRSIVSLFDGLLDIATIDGATGLKHAAPFDLSEVTASVAELYAASAEEAGVEFAVRITPDITLLGEPMQMARLVANLLDNALKYVPAGSHVRLKLEAGPRLIVEDDGPGIPPADRERVFHRFTRGDASQPGHGLGLALVKVIALRHGLAARVEDAQPGARFVVEAGK